MIKIRNHFDGDEFIKTNSSLGLMFKGVNNTEFNGVYFIWHTRKNMIRKCLHPMTFKKQNVPCNLRITYKFSNIQGQWKFTKQVKWVQIES